MFLRLCATIALCCSVATALSSRTNRGSRLMYTPDSNTATVPLQNAAVDGLLMPVVGLGVGTYGSRTGDGYNGENWNNSVAYEAVTDFFNVGGRRIDTSLKWYHDLPGVGQAMMETSLDRSEYFITCKVDDPFGYNNTMKHIDTILRRLNTDYCDLILAHWPGYIGWSFSNYSLTTELTLNETEIEMAECRTNNECRQQTWLALVDAWKEGKADAVGVANYEKSHFQDLLALDVVLPAVNQIEYHPYWHEDDWVNELQGMGIVVNGYSPLGAPDFMAWHSDRWPVPILQQPDIQAIAESYGKTTAQAILAWEVAQGVVVNPRSENATHMADNLNIFDFELTQDEQNTIASVPHPLRNKVCPDPIVIP